MVPSTFDASSSWNAQNYAIDNSNIKTEVDKMNELRDIIKEEEDIAIKSAQLLQMLEVIIKFMY